MFAFWRQGSSFTFYCMASGIGVSVVGARCRLQCLRTPAKEKGTAVPRRDQRQTVHCTLITLFRIYALVGGPFNSPPGRCMLFLLGAALMTG